MLTQVGVTGGLPLMILASIVVSIGLAPVFGLTTEIIVGSAPPERAGAASGISETGAELGGALGIAILGSVGVAIYRGEVGRGLSAAIPADSLAAARDTLGSAVAAAGELPAELAATLLDSAFRAFVTGMQLSAGFAAVVSIGMAVMTIVALRSHRLHPPDEEFEAESATHDRRESTLEQVRAA
jgi:DHA2 family multidrug resistance protein-like MFS transporter